MDAQDLTADWLTEHLGRTIVDVEVLGRSVATNLHVRLGLTDDAGARTTLFAKLPPLDPMHRAAIGASGMGEREACFYESAAGSVPLRVPAVAAVVRQDEGDFVLLLEDLVAAGCRLSDATWGVGADQAASAMEDLARFHVQYEGVEVAWAAEPRATGGEWTLSTLRHVITEFAGVLSPDYVAVGELYLDHHAELEALWGAGPSTLCHGDAHIGNVFLDGDRVGFLDWGLATLSGPMRDVSYFLTMTVDPEVRRARQEDLVRLYLDRRAALGGAPIAFDEAWRQHRVNSAYTVIASFLGLVPPYATAETQPLATDLRTRSILALEDLDTVSAVREALRR